MEKKEPHRFASSGHPDACEDGPYVFIRIRIHVHPSSIHHCRTDSWEPGNTKGKRCPGVSTRGGSEKLFCRYFNEALDGSWGTRQMVERCSGCIDGAQIYTLVHAE